MVCDALYCIFIPISFPCCFPHPPSGRSLTPWNSSQDEPTWVATWRCQGIGPVPWISCTGSRGKRRRERARPTLWNFSVLQVLRSLVVWRDAACHGQGNLCKLVKVRGRIWFAWNLYRMFPFRTHIYIYICICVCVYIYIKTLSHSTWVHRPTLAHLPLDPRAAVTCLLKCRIGQFMALFALKCSSFTAANQGTSGRSFCASIGNHNYRSVYESNALLERHLAMLRCTIFLWTCIYYIKP